MAAKNIKVELKPVTISLNDVKKCIIEYLEAHFGNETIAATLKNVDIEKLIDTQRFRKQVQHYNEYYVKGEMNLWGALDDSGVFDAVSKIARKNIVMPDPEKAEYTVSFKVKGRTKLDNVERIMGTMKGIYDIKKIEVAK